MNDTLNRAVEAHESQVISPLRDRKASPPPAWKPGIVWTDSEAELTTEPSPVPLPYWDDIIRHLGYDPAVYEIVEPVKVSSWDVQTTDGTQQLWSYKAGIRLRSSQVATIDYDDLIREVKRHRPMKEMVVDGDLTMIVCLADWQIGKHDNDGVKGTIERIMQMIDDVERRIRDLKLIGRNIAKLIIIGMGDMIEGCDGNYASQIWNVELNRREQIRVTRRLIYMAITRWAKLVPAVTVTCVPGNHGENRKDGKAFTNPGDNDDVAVFEIIAEVLAENPKAYGHVEFHIPENETNITFNIGGTIIGFTHGHITKGGGTPQAKIKSWWEDQTFAHRPVGDAQILVTAHYHHFSVIEYGPKIHIQCPTVDGGSEWWADLDGADSRQGTLTFLVGGSKPYQDLEII